MQNMYKGLILDGDSVNDFNSKIQKAENGAELMNLIKQ